MESSGGKWEIWIDRGGTFTDLVARKPDNSIVTTKVLSENPEVYKDAAIFGIRSLMGLTQDEPIPGHQIAAVKMGTTVATNALLERKGDRTLLITNKGLRDALRIAYQARPNIFARQIVLPELVYEQVAEVSGRVSVDGEELEPLHEDEVKACLKEAYDAGIRGVAVCLMHAYRYPTMEQRIGELASQAGFTQVSISSTVSPLMKLVSRGDTTTVDAYLSPILRRYVDRVASELGPSVKLMFMQSSGGLKDASLFQGKDSILSGPAGGIVGAARTCELNGFPKIVGFDMGGTSTDVCHYRGELERVFETEVAGVRVRAPMMHIHTVAAGGGSLLAFDGTRLRVGPESAGANPGPACYRRGGPRVDVEPAGVNGSKGMCGLAISDVNVLLGKLRPEYFPSVFGPNMNEPLDVAEVAKRFEAVTQQINAAFPHLPNKDTYEVASGFLAIAVDHMAIAIKEITTRRGIDVAGSYTLCSFGGAGGQHACLVADALGITSVFLHPYAGVLSAFGMGLADIRTFEEAVMEKPLEGAGVGGGSSLGGEGVSVGGVGSNESEALIDAAFVDIFDTVVSEAVAGVKAQMMLDEKDDSANGKEVFVACRAQLRYQGTDSTILCDWPSRAAAAAVVATALARADAADAVKRDFEARHQQQFGFLMAGKPLVVQSVSAEAWVYASDVKEPLRPQAPTAPDPSTGEWPLNRPNGQLTPLSNARKAEEEGGDTAHVQCYMDGAMRTTPVYGRSSFYPGDEVAGPCIIVEDTGTTVVELGWSCTCNDRGCLILNRAVPKKHTMAMGTQVDPVTLEIFNNLFMAIAEQMGVTLQNVSYSVNIKERLDFSCALFDPDGNLIANAPHVPVHLGSMSEAVKSVIESRSFDDMAPGDVYMCNAPYNGGTHIPDVTVITPIFAQAAHEEAARQATTAAADEAASAEKAAARGVVVPLICGAYSLNKDTGCWEYTSHAAAATAESAASEKESSPKRVLIKNNKGAGWGRPLFFVASRGHHSEIGGITPGSMPPFSRSIEEEGIMFVDWLLVDRGTLREAPTRQLFSNHQYPSRNVDQNLSDLRAQIAANACGMAELHKLVNDFGLETVCAYMGHVQDNAEEAVRRVIDDLPIDRPLQFTYAMDNGEGHGKADGNPAISIKVTIDRPGRSALIDFTGTAPQQPTNFNAPIAIAQAAVLYVFRTLVDDAIPLNAGCLKPITLVLPPGSMVNPRYPAAVVAGNVEVSQCITDCLYGALGIMAGAQGTMNNFTFGNASGVNYYETICGGTGAGKTFNGCDAVHSHMTNTRLTDPEVLEFRFPLRVESFSIRRGSGGGGQHKGGDGIERKIKFLAPMTVGILANRREVAPFGLEGGLPGALGMNWVERAPKAHATSKNEKDANSKDVGAGTEKEVLGHRGTAELLPGDTFVILTPGGGGFGAPSAL